jgi:hypothetical protein
MSPPERKYQTWPNRYGEGHVHRYIYDSLNKVWYCLCRGPGKDPHGRVVESRSPVTCSKCDPSLRHHD